MEERVMQFYVGVFCIVSLIGAAIMLVLFGKLPPLTGRTYAVHARFDYASGVGKDTPVRKSGILIGRVSDVQLTDDDAKVLVSMNIYSDKKIFWNEDCCLVRDLLGDTALAFIPNAKRAAKRQPIEPGTILDGLAPEDPTGLKRALQGPIDTVEETGKALTAASRQLGEAAERVEKILNVEAEQNVQDILRDAAKSLKALQKVFGDEETQTKFVESLRKLPETIDSMNRTFHATDETLRQFTQPSPADGRTPIERMVRTIEMTERTIHKFSEPAGPGQLAPADQVAKALNDMGEVASLVRSVVARIDSGEGTVGALLKDRELYDRLNRTVRNLEEVSRKLRPIVDDARVFTDKVARHPGVIVRDAVRPGAGIK